MSELSKNQTNTKNAIYNYAEFVRTNMYFKNFVKIIVVCSRIKSHDLKMATLDVRLKKFNKIFREGVRLFITSS